VRARDSEGSRAALSLWLHVAPPVNRSIRAARFLLALKWGKRFRAMTHDSGPVRVATPLLYDSCIHNALPVLTGAQ
jgi:hypothetical protein